LITVFYILLTRDHLLSSIGILLVLSTFVFFYMFSLRGGF
jgi:hypothetical protein